MKSLSLQFGLYLPETVIRLDDEPDQATSYEILNLLGSKSGELFTARVNTQQITLLSQDETGYSAGICEDQLLLMLIDRNKVLHETTKDSYYLGRINKLKELLLC